MNQLILTMIVALEEYDNSLNYTKEDIENIMNKYNYLNENITCNERGYIILWKNKYITNEQFTKYMGGEIIDNNFYFVCDNFDSILSNDYESEIKILDGEMDFDPGSWYDNDISEQWYYYDEEVLEKIKNYCIREELEIDDVLLTDENLNIVDGKLFYNDDELVDFIDSDDLSELKSDLNSAICDASDDAQYSEIYNKTKEHFIDDVGEYEIKTINIGDKQKEKLYINLNISFDEIEEWLIDSYNEFEFEDQNYGDLKSILTEMDYFNFKKVDYDYLNAYASNKSINEFTKERL